MSVELRFLGWDAPVTARISEFLLPQGPGGAASLARDLIVVPTRQAGRRLREALAVRGSSLKTALPPVRVVTPAFFLQPEEGPSAVAAPLEVAAAWVDVLMKADLGRYRSLFPAQVANRDFHWALRTGEMIEGLRVTLADGGYRIGDVFHQFGSLLEEKERWSDLAALEEACLETLGALGLQDPTTWKLRTAEDPEPPSGADRLLLAAVPAPTPLVVKTLERLAARIPIVVLVHAPESLADAFDPWGRPLAEKWRERRIEVPDPGANLILGGPPRDQGRRALKLVAEEASHPLTAGGAGRFGPADVALGVPDEEIVPFLEADLAAAGLVPFDPAGRPADRHPLAQLLEAFRALRREGDYPAASGFLRNSDFLEHLQKKHRLPPGRVLEEADRFQNQRLPQSLDDLVRGLERPAGFSGGGPEYPALARAVQVAAGWVRAFETGEPEASLRSFLQAIYELRVLDSARPGDSDFVAVAELVDAGLRRLARGAPAALGLDRWCALDLLLWSLGRERYYPEPEGSVIDLEGWLELPWNDAPFLVITGMNDGRVPDTRPADVFLPDSLRRQLHLPHDDDRLARDAYVMASLIESRRAGGRVCFIAGKTGATGDVLKPSRLLFQCPDEELPRRAARLFGNPDQAQAGHPSSICFRLEAAPPPDVPPDSFRLDKMPVTAFRDYLYCPFRYYLKHVLGMKALDDRKTELDAMDFGSLVHYALHRMALDDQMRQCGDVPRLQEFLCARAADWVAEWCGPEPSLPVEVQLESARQRLRRAAIVQAGLVREGWEIVHAEMGIGGSISGVQVRGKIDRVDRHRETGRTRLLDYKTSEKGPPPGAAHFGPVPVDRECREYALIEVGGRQRRWTDLQLPLYAILLPSCAGLTGPFELGYFNLPKALDDTQVVPWDDAPPHLLESALACAEGVIGDIRDRRFWPPARKVTYDDFAGLFPGDPARCVNEEAFLSFLDEGRAA